MSDFMSLVEAAGLNLLYTGIPLFILTLFGWLLVFFAARLANRPMRRASTLMASLGVLGSVVGFAAGSSRTPVMGYVLPAVLTFISGILAYLLGREQLDAEMAQLRTRIPYLILVLCLNAFFGEVFGASVRQQQEEDDRKYEEWHSCYEKVYLPTEALRASHTVEGKPVGEDSAVCGPEDED